MKKGKSESTDLVGFYKHSSNFKKKIIITGEDLIVSDIIAVARHNKPVELSKDPRIVKKVQASYEKMMEQVKDGVPIYGCNTGYGARASNVVADAETIQKRFDLARKISETIIHTDVTVGPLFPKEIVRAAMLIRINMLMKGVSAVKIEDLQLYCDLLNKQITPVVSQYGGVGASGDLAHNSRVLSVARGLKGAKVEDKNGDIREAAEVLKEEGIKPLQLDPKAGLGLVNGDNFSTAVAALLAFDTLEVFLLANTIGAMMIEVLMGTDRQFHPLLAEVRPHDGQRDISAIYRYLLEGSNLANQEMKGHKRRPRGVNVQDAYSLRCVSQYHAVNAEKIYQAFETININANSVSDNPLWVAPEFVTEGEEPWQWVSGGNFIAMHMVEVIDGLRKTMTQITKLNDRQLSRLVSLHHNNNLPPNLSDDKAISHCAFKGVQIQSGMFDVYSSILSVPVSTFFGVHEEMNQDITSHALTSGILGLENLKIARYSTAQNMVAVAQAVDLRGGVEKLSTKTQPVYRFIRHNIEYVEEERPLGCDIEKMYSSILSGQVFSLVKDDVFAGY